ncbi:MAG: hypothetical protein CMJ49_07830 [Planctomycetaceae bacterium]|nr:hypothetical protein [Planctomycetaceae bacterium]
MAPAEHDVDASATHLYFTDVHNRRLRTVDFDTGVITTIAGGGPDDPGDGGPATCATFSTHPMRVRLDAAGHIFVTDAHQNRVRRIDAQTRIITTVAGNGDEAYRGDGGPATEAALTVPHDARFDRAGNLYIADTRANRVRKVDAATGMITTLAGTGEAGYAGDGGPAVAAQLDGPLALDIDTAGNIYIIDTDALRLRRVDAATGLITTVAGCGDMGPTESGIPAVEAKFGRPRDVKLIADDCLYLLDGNNASLMRIDLATGLVHVIAGCNVSGFAGDGGPAADAQMGHPYSMAIDPAGNLYFKDCTNRRIRKIDAATGIMSTFAGNGERGWTGDGGPALDASLGIG